MLFPVPPKFDRGSITLPDGTILPVGSSDPTFDNWLEQLRNATDIITASEINGDQFGTLTITAGKIIISTTDGLEIAGTGNVKVTEGGDIIMIGNDSNPGNFIFQGSSYEILFYLNSVGSNLYLGPKDTDDKNQINLYLGTGAKPYKNLRAYGEGLYDFGVYDSATNGLARMLGSAGAGSKASWQVRSSEDIIVALELWATTGSGDYLELNADRFIPSADSTSSIGTTDLRWLKGWFDEIEIGNQSLVVAANGHITFGGKVHTDAAPIGLDVLYTAVIGAHLEVGDNLTVGGTIINTDFTTLTDNSMADSLHRHSELSASDGAPDAVLSFGSAGNALFLKVNPVFILQNTNDTGFEYFEFGKTVDSSFVRSGYVGEPSSGNDNISLCADIADLILDAANDIILSPTGNVGIGTPTPSILFDLNAKIGFTAIGGLAIKLTNKTGSNSVEGEIVETDATTANAVNLADAGDVQSSGVFYESGIADGSETWIIISGIAEVRADAGGFVKGDRLITSATVGRAAVDNAPAVAVHFQEIGHAIEDAAANAIGKCIIGFL